MKFISLILAAFLVFFICTKSNAQNVNEKNYSKISHRNMRDIKSPIVEISDFKVSNQDAEAKWKTLRSTGIALTGAGVIVAAIGFKLILDNNKALMGADRMPPKYHTGRVLLPIGATVAAGGITMWAIGNNRLRKMRDVSIRTNGTAVGLVCKF